jgi:FkbM family methyltransferase
MGPGALAWLNGAGVLLSRFGLRGMVKGARNALTIVLGNRLTATVAGMTLHGSFAHRHYLQALTAGRSDSLMMRLFCEAVRPGTVVLDIGAHLGVFTLLAAVRVGQAGRVYAFEPDPRNARPMRRSLSRTELSSRVTLVEAAAGAEPGKRAFHLHSSDLSQSGFHASGSGLPIQVDVVVPDRLIGDALPSVIKIDVEGAELQVLAGLRQTLERDIPDLTLFVECNPPALAAAGASEPELLRELRRHGFQLWRVDEGEGIEVPVTGERAVQEGAGKRYLNLACRRAG